MGVSLRALALLTAFLALPLPSAGIDFGLAEGPAVIDQAGRRTPVPRPFGRIISLYGAHTENLFALGAGGQLVGVSPREEYPPEAARLPAFSYRDDPEKFLAARPDLVLIRPMIERGYPQLVQRLVQSGIAVVSIQPDDVAGMLAYWEILGVLSGRREEADRMAEGFRRAVASIRRLTADRVERRRVYFEAIHDKMKTFAPGSMALFALEAAGGVNAADDAVPVRDTHIAFYGKERLLARGEAIDVYLAQSGPMNPVRREQIAAESGFQAIRAVREGRIHLIDERLVSRPTPRLLEGICAIGRILYPELFAGRCPEELMPGPEKQHR